MDNEIIIKEQSRIDYLVELEEKKFEKLLDTNILSNKLENLSNLLECFSLGITDLNLNHIGNICRVVNGLSSVKDSISEIIEDYNELVLELDFQSEKNNMLQKLPLKNKEPEINKIEMLQNN